MPRPDLAVLPAAARERAWELLWRHLLAGSPAEDDREEESEEGDVSEVEAA